MLSAGSRVGPYEVVAPLGAGGMGEVYRARDPRLGRDVALKVLPEQAAGDAERLSRFQREARAVASLNHPHILAVHDIGSDDGVDYVVFELLGGETLRRRLESGPLPARKVVDYGIQICRGLTAAHAQGVIHRDLKPDNLFLTTGGQVKILDFGLAKQTGPGPGDNELERAETRTAETEAGRVMGTSGYMSPEQAQGQPADARSDLFALGVVLYEMLSGKRAFGGSTPEDTLAAVLRSDPPEIETSRVPAGLERVVRRCLEKDPGERFQSAHDLGLALETLSGPEGPHLRSQRWLRARLRWPAGLLLVLAVVAGVVTTWWLWGRGQTPSGPLRVVPFTADGGFKWAPRVSPDGERVAYTWAGSNNDNYDIYVKAIGRGTRPLRLTEDEALDWGPVWSPDGRQIAFVRGFERRGAIYTVPSLGGQERRLVDVAGPPQSLDKDVTYALLSWSPDGEWLALGERPREDEPARIVRLSLTTLEKTALTSPPADFFGDLEPAISPDGRQLAFVRVGPIGWGMADVWVQSVTGQQARQLTFENYERCSGLAWTADGGELVFATNTHGLGSGGEIVRLSLAGRDPTPLAGIGRDVAGPSVRAGRMVFAQLFPAPWDIWRIPGRRSSVADRKAEKLIASRWNDADSVYSPDGQRIVFLSDRSGTNSVWVSHEDGSNPTLVAVDSILGSSRSPWSPDSLSIVVGSLESGNADLYLVDSEGGRPRRLTHEPSADTSGTFSRDGRSIYFTSDRSGSLQIWKMPAGGGPATQVTAGGGDYARESWEAHSVYYERHTGEGYEIWRVPAQGGEETFVLRVRDTLNGWDLSPTGIYYATQRALDGPINADYAVHYLDFETGRTETLFRREGPFWHWSFSVSPDEEWILFGEVPATQSELMLVENFR